MGALQADFASHHIEGYAVAAMEQGKSGKFNAPLISHIEGDLYVGGCIDGVNLGDEFDTVVSLYKWERYRYGEGTAHHEFMMYDSGDEPDEATIEVAAQHVVDALSSGRKTLVHCQAGLNRSNLVAARALILMGRPAAEAITLLREKRSPVVLCNATFEAWLLDPARAA